MSKTQLTSESSSDQELWSEWVLSATIACIVGTVVGGIALLPLTGYVLDFVEPRRTVGPLAGVPGMIVE